MKFRNGTLVLGLALLVSGCAQPTYLTPDFSRAYISTFEIQSDLSRPSVQGSTYFLYGVEAAQIRVRVAAATATGVAAGGGGGL